MKRTPPSNTSAYELLKTDAELAHLRILVDSEVHNVSPVFPLSYWRSRVVHILETRHLFPAQLAIASALMDLIECADGVDRLH
ncbi:hypothetical protein [Caballeronia cordobensis]|uniref:Uncharacterized protein n=1 Tax=Caballeronia cordobensis TaxID=1353886 RepID=A0A158JTY1_CABCO|nr:hypothetical protein [Caballeronia cordobensis]BAO88206.1 putative uncharacterized protein [Burkholderia sp. RPE67]SAL72362.1 hypothetical protein AWB70_07515 [Caballeronia cordobensis]